MLYEMNESDRSKHSSPSVVKKRNSSGCLIIKKTVNDSGFNDSSSRNLKEKKRQRVVRSDSEYSDDSSSEAETIRRKVGKFHNGSGVYKGAYLEDREFETEKRASNGLDVFEFDEYDGFDDNMIRKNVNDGSYQWNLHRQSATQIGAKSRIDMEDDESDLPLSVLSQKYRSSSNKAIRVQGKNGVLKVMVNKNKQMGESCKSSDGTEAEDRKELSSPVLKKKKSHVSEDTSKDKAAIKPSLYSNFKDAGKPAVSEKSKQPLKSHSRREVIKHETSVTTPTKNVTQGKGKESRLQRGSGTEKQILREKIKNMLLGAGWTIDYRPRRNRDYLDAVYISPGGTGYWSIIKAYDALQKEEEDNSKTGGSFTPLPEELLGKLTRQTQKKIEREMINKRKNEGSDQKEVKQKHRRKLKKSRREEESQDSVDDSSESSDDEMANYENAAKTMVGASSHTMNGRKNKKIGRCTLLVRGSEKGLNSENDGFVQYSGKRTLLSWLIDSGVVQMSEHVEYMNRRKTRILQKGWITKDGIHCGCCSKIVTVFKFELHAGSKLRQPFPNMFLESGKSLLQCQIDAWNKQGELERKGFYMVDTYGDDPNDDTCGLCGDGGDLICCDGCPSTFHQSCLDIQMLPQGDWHCPNCCCKYCQIASGNCTDVGCKTETSLLTCCFCQKKYHESCRPVIDDKKTESIYMNLSFCQPKCHELYSHLQKLLGVKHELDSGFSWSLIHRSDLSADTSSSEFSQRVESNSMLAIAMSIMDECFLPFTDRRSGTNLIHNVVLNCGSNLSRLNYTGFFTAILERGDEVLCAASIRIHGTQLAEMPFIGTRHIYRRQGMCRRLLSAIESALSSLQVEKLIIPAVAERMHTWTDVFGFHPLEESHKKELRSLNMLVFPGTDMLQKPLVKQANPNAMPQGNDTVEANKYNVISSDVKGSSDKTAATDSGSQQSSVLLDDDCSVAGTKEIVPNNSPVKDDKPLAVSVNKLVSSSCAELDHNMGNDASKTADPDSHPAQISDLASHDIAVSSEVPCEGGLQLLVSQDSHFEPKVEESTVRLGDKIQLVVPVVPSSEACEPKHRMPGKESAFSIQSHSDPNIEEISFENGEGTNPLPTQVHDTFASVDIQEIVVQKSSGVNLLEAETSNLPLKNTVSSDSHCEQQLQPCGIESRSLDGYMAETVEKSSCDVSPLILGTTNNSLEAESSSVPLKDVVSSDLRCERELQSCELSSRSLDALTADGVEKSSSDISSMILEATSISLEAEASNVPLKDSVASGLPCEHEVHPCELKSGSLDAHTAERLEKLSSDASPVILDTPNNSLAARASNVPLRDIISSDSPCEHELHSCVLESRSLDAHIAEGVEKSSSDVNPVILETTNDTTDVSSLEAKTSYVPLMGTVSSDSPCDNQLQSCGSDSCSLDAKNSYCVISPLIRQTTNYTTDVNSVDHHTAETVEKPSSDVSSVILETSNNTTDVKSLEAEASDVPLINTVLSHPPCEQPSLDANTAERVEKSSFDTSPVIPETTNNNDYVNSVIEKPSSDVSPVILKTSENDKIQFSEGVSCECELKAPENQRAIP